MTSSKGRRPAVERSLIVEPPLGIAPSPRAYRARMPNYGHLGGRSPRDPNTNTNFTEPLTRLKPMSTIDEAVRVGGDLANGDGPQPRARLEQLDELLYVVLRDRLRVDGDATDLDERFHKGSAVTSPCGPPHSSSLLPSSVDSEGVAPSTFAMPSRCSPVELRTRAWIHRDSNSDFRDANAAFCR